MKTLADRLKSAMDDAHLSQSEVARRVGVSRSAVSLWLSGAVADLSGENLIKVASILGVTNTWLSTGKGNRNTQSPEKFSSFNVVQYPQIPRVEIVITAPAKYRIDPLGTDEAPLILSRKWYEDRGFAVRALFCAEVTEDAMAPSLYRGDWVMINTSSTSPKDGFVFAIIDEDRAVVRRLFKSGGDWVAASDNADKRIYRDKPLSDAFVIGQVVFKQSEQI